MKLWPGGIFPNIVFAWQHASCALLYSFAANSFHQPAFISSNFDLALPWISSHALASSYIFEMGCIDSWYIDGSVSCCLIADSWLAAVVCATSVVSLNLESTSIAFWASLTWPSHSCSAPVWTAFWARSFMRNICFSPPSMSLTDRTAIKFKSSNKRVVVVVLSILTESAVSDVSVLNASCSTELAVSVVGFVYWMSRAISRVLVANFIMCLVTSCVKSMEGPALFL